MGLNGNRNENLYGFDDVVVDAENFRAERNGQILTLTPKAFDVLAFLVKNSSRVVEKQELFDNVWKDTIVSDNALTKIVKEIRQALKDPADAPRYIETVPKRGYRFIGRVTEKYVQETQETEKDDTGATVKKEGQTKRPGLSLLKPVFILPVIGLMAAAILGLWSLWPQNSAENPAGYMGPIRTIAVLPFKPLNDDSRDESLEMGMAETLITRLSNLKQMAVRPISAVSKYTGRQQDPAEAGRETQVEAVLDGSIQKADERVRVTVRLISVRDGATLWSEQFDEKFTDIFKVQDSIAEKITNALALRLSKQEKEQLAKHYTDNPEAYQLYLQGQLIWHRRGDNWIKQSLASYQQALERDSNFALAHIGVADSYIMLSGHRRISMQEAEDKARPAIVKALEIDDKLAQAHNALAELIYQYEYDWPGAEKEFKAALELNPNVAWIHQAYGWFLMSDGRFDEAGSEMDRARELDPSSLTINIGRGRLFYYSRQYDQAIRHFQNILAIEPEDGSSLYSLCEIYEQKQMYPESLEAYIKANKTKPERAEEYRAALMTSGWKGFLLKQLEKAKASEAATGNPPMSNYVDLYTRLGEKDQAFSWLRKNFESRYPRTLQFKIEPAYDILRDDPRYAELLGKIGLKP